MSKLDDENAARAATESKTIRCVMIFTYVVIPPSTPSCRCR